MMRNLSQRQSEILEALRINALALEEIAEALHVSRTAAQKHLEKLLHAGLAQEERQEKTAGRPRIVYCLTDKGRELFPRRYSWFTDHFLSTLKKDMGPQKTVELMHSLARDMGKSDAVKLAGQSLSEKTAAIVAVMNEIGYEARAEEMKSKTEAEISACNCVYHHLAKNHKEVCEFDIELLKTLSGADVELTECIVRGGQLCRFKINTTK